MFSDQVLKDDWNLWKLDKTKSDQIYRQVKDLSAMNLCQICSKRASLSKWDDLSSCYSSLILQLSSPDDFKDVNLCLIRRPPLHEF